MLVLTWNLFHGRSLPPSGRDLRPDFTARLAAWEWDVALLQEVPPWWPVPLGRASHASARMALTSRNWLLGLRRPLAIAFPDLLKSEGGGANAILVRGQAIVEHRRVELRRKPERRVAHAVRLADGTWIANLHGQVHSEVHALTDLATAGRALDGWSGGGPALLGGDTNTRRPRVDGYELLGIHDVDALLARGWEAAHRARALDRGALSDHAPVLLDVRAAYR